MPKGNKKKANKNKRQALTRRPMPELDDGQDYAVCVKVLGNRSFSIKFPDGIIRLGMLRGSVKKKHWVGLGTWVIAGKRQYEEAKCDISTVLDDYEVTQLSNKGALSLVLAKGLREFDIQQDELDIEWASKDQTDISDDIIDMI